MKDTFKLNEIADWQLNAQQSIVELPLIQRGFVWKSKQVEDLWDSLLRGYPIGSFLFSETGNRFYLMDGQQRSTSIFLGHFNPYNLDDTVHAWSIKGQLPTVWIDLKPTDKPVSSKYLIRLTTQSHPWGYQAGSNEKKLSVSDRRHALSLFRQHSENKGLYTTFRNTSIFPYDSTYPIPLSFLIESTKVNEVIEMVERHLPSYFSTKSGGFDNKESFVKILKSELKQDLEELLEVVKQAQETEIKSTTIKEKVLHEEQEEESPTLFVRINSSGTPLTGDDLIYSIYKAIFPHAKNLIDRIGLSFIPPTQVLSLASRIVASDLEENRYIKKMSVRDFQKRVKEPEFKSQLEKIIEDGTLHELFERAISILSCKENSEFKGEVPSLIIKQFIQKNQDLFYFFVYWLHKNDGEPSLSVQLKMTAKLMVFSWFNFSNIPRLWNSPVTDPVFWEKPLNDLIWWDGVDGIHFLIKPELLRAYYQQSEVEEMFRKVDRDRWGLWKNGVGDDIAKYMCKVKGEDFTSEKVNEYFWKFIGRIQYNRSLILFAQREYINNTFPEFNQMEEIEDTNVPWDWDHIYPSEWVYRKGNCHQAIRDWNNTNGNFRAISLEQNRSRGSSQAPSALINEDERDISFINENDWKYWKEIHGRIHGDQIYNHFRAITSRTVNIYEEFWRSFHLEELIEE